MTASTTKLKLFTLVGICGAMCLLVPSVGGCSMAGPVRVHIKGEIIGVPLLNFDLIVDWGSAQTELPGGSVYKGKVVKEGREYAVFVAPDGSVWVEIGGRYYKLKSDQIPPEIRRLLNGVQQVPPTEQDAATAGLTQSVEPLGDRPDPMGEPLDGSYEFDTDANQAMFEVTAEVDPEYDPTPIQGNFNVTIDVQHHEDGTATIRLEGSVNGVLSAAMLIGVQRIHDPDTEWGDAEIILSYDWSMAFINHNGQPYTEIVLYENQ